MATGQPRLHHPRSKTQIGTTYSRNEKTCGEYSGSFPGEGQHQSQNSSSAVVEVKLTRGTIWRMFSGSGRRSTRRSNHLKRPSQSILVTDRHGKASCDFPLGNRSFPKMRLPAVRGKRIKTHLSRLRVQTSSHRPTRSNRPAFRRLPAHSDWVSGIVRALKPSSTWPDHPGPNVSSNNQSFPPPQKAETLIEQARAQRISREFFRGLPHPSRSRERYPA